MQPSTDISDQQEDERVSVVMLEKLGQTLRASFETMTEEPIPREMALLLLRLAFAEIVYSAASEELRKTGSGEAPQRRMLEVEEHFAAAAAVVTSSCV
ncbi:hypothetical protein ACNHKD_16550 [Methylocystis sp. JAN1]|uniref:hypothetical protein n=1 Tax=Methylocystis sp. JAN1 TaxID=3397211 RepID=UPI003FA29045